MNFNIENKKILSLKELETMDDKNLEILGVILVVGNPNQSNVDLPVSHQIDNKADLLTANQVYRKIKKKEPISTAALRSFMNRLRNQGLAAVHIGGEYLYKPEDLDQFLEKRKKH